jgi:hypothetical protein
VSVARKVHDEGPDSAPQDERSAQKLLRVQQGRAAATRGLLHDFSNVMVGLCSLSENALEETDPASPLHNDMEIIRDSAVRAHQLIRRIVTLNNPDDAEACLIDITSWLRNEAETLRALLPKGSDVIVAEIGRTVLVHVREDLLRDFIILAALDISRSQHSRISVQLGARVEGGLCHVDSLYSFPRGGTDSAQLSAGLIDQATAAMMAKAMSGRHEVRTMPAGALCVSLALPLA